MKMFEKTSNIRHTHPNRPTSLVTSVPPVMRDFMDLNDKSIILWEAYGENNKKKIIITKIGERE